MEPNAGRYSVLSVLLRFLFCTALLFPSLAAAQESILLGTRAVKRDEALLIYIDFSVRMHYFRHFPFARGDVLQIQLRPAELDDATPGTRVSSLPNTAKRESLVPDISDITPLAFVSYEGDVPGGPYLTLRFKTPVDYAVEEGPGSQSIVVRIEKRKLGLVVRALPDANFRSDPSIDKLMSDALQAISASDYPRAIVLLTRLLELPTHAHSQNAKELLGIAREQKGDGARAKLEYLEYLRLYPDTPGAERVNQRLSAMLMGETQAGEPAALPSGGPATSFFGRFSQRYSADSTNAKTTDLKTTNAALTSSLNVSSRFDYEHYEYRSYVDARSVHTVSGLSNKALDVNSLYVAVKDKSTKDFLSLGRQISAYGGIFGRYDGAWGTHPLSSSVELNAVVGQPVEPLYDNTRAQRKFAGTSLSIGSYVDPYHADIYAIEQRIEKIVDRRALGGDVRINGDMFSLFGSFDYDTAYHVLNIFTLNAGWRVTQKTQLSVNYDVRQSPLAQTSNALQQEPDIRTFNQLTQIVTTADARDKVRDMFSFARRLTLSAVHQYSLDTYIYADVNVMSADSRPRVLLLNWQNEDPLDPGYADPRNDANYIVAQERYGPEYLYSLQAVSNNLLRPNDTQTFGVRCSIGAHRSLQSLFLRSQYVLNDRWNVAPRIQYDRTHTWRDDTVALHPSLGLKLDYRWSKGVSFEADASREYNNTYRGTAPNDYARTLYYVGYNVDF